MHLALKTPLPGREAQLEMAPAYRRPSIINSAPETAMEAGVLTLLSPTNEGRDLAELLSWHVLLIRRNCYPGVHSGQISFPGGRREKVDSSLWETACREGFEEVGVPRRCLDRVGLLTRIYVPASNFVVYPFMAVNNCHAEIVLDSHEAVQFKQIPLNVFNPRNAVSLPFPYEGGTRPAPAWKYEDFTIWGATAMVLAEVYRTVERGLLVWR